MAENRPEAYCRTCAMGVPGDLERRRRGMVNEHLVLAEDMLQAARLRKLSGAELAGALAQVKAQLDCPEVLRVD